MQNLNKFIKDQNAWTAFFGSAPVTFPLTQAAADQVARTLDAKLSPENLHCDGEITIAEAERKYRYLSTVARELEAYCNANKLTMPEVYEL